MGWSIIYFIDNSFEDSFSFSTNNIIGTQTLLEAAKTHPLYRFIHISTDEVYGEIDFDKVVTLKQKRWHCFKVRYL